jgi:hypothetical protein
MSNIAILLTVNPVDYPLEKHIKMWRPLHSYLLVDDLNRKGSQDNNKLLPGRFFLAGYARLGAMMKKEKGGKDAPNMPFCLLVMCGCH